LGKTGDIILDPFVGCGTSLVAAQQYDRTVYGLEMSAEYIAITLQRLADMGLEPRLVDSIANI
jgi:DNA modification methylase